MPQLSPVDAALARLSAKLATVDCQLCPLEEAAGRVLGEVLLADRDSPPLDVSAMDGYALKLSDWDGQRPLPVQATACAGSPPQVLRSGQAIKIFTGGPLPADADCVVRREDTRLDPAGVLVTVPVAKLCRGQNIRRRAENAPRGKPLLEQGTLLDAARMAAVASFAAPQLSVRRRVRVAIVNTGDELAQPGAEVADWQIRDSNGPWLQSWLASCPWVEIVARQRVRDTLDAVSATLADLLPRCDAVLLTGGVSMGDTDFVPAAVEALGGEIVFHRLPIRPGKPVLGAAVDGKLVLGLPGNPASVAVTSRVFGEPLLLRQAGCISSPGRPLVHLADPDDKRLELTWYRLVRLGDAGQVHLLASQGSGDVVALSLSDGFVELLPGASPSTAVRLTVW